MISLLLSLIKVLASTAHIAVQCLDIVIAIVSSLIGVLAGMSYSSFLYFVSVVLVLCVAVWTRYDARALAHAAINLHKLGRLLFKIFSWVVCLFGLLYQASYVITLTRVLAGLILGLIYRMILFTWITAVPGSCKSVGWCFTLVVRPAGSVCVRWIQATWDSKWPGFRQRAEIAANDYATALGLMLFGEWVFEEDEINDAASLKTSFKRKGNKGRKVYKVRVRRARRLFQSRRESGQLSEYDDAPEDFPGNAGQSVESPSPGQAACPSSPNLLPGAPVVPAALALEAPLNDVPIQDNSNSQPSHVPNPPDTPTQTSILAPTSDEDSISALITAMAAMNVYADEIKKDNKSPKKAHPATPEGATVTQCEQPQPGVCESQDTSLTSALSSPKPGASNPDPSLPALVTPIPSLRPGDTTGLGYSGRSTLPGLDSFVLPRAGRPVECTLMSKPNLTELIAEMKAMHLGVGEYKKDKPLKGKQARKSTGAAMFQVPSPTYGQRKPAVNGSQGVNPTSTLSSPSSSTSDPDTSFDQSSFGQATTAGTSVATPSSVWTPASTVDSLPELVDARTKGRKGSEPKGTHTLEFSKPVEKPMTQEPLEANSRPRTFRGLPSRQLASSLKLPTAPQPAYIHPFNPFFPNGVVPTTYGFNTGAGRLGPNYTSPFDSFLAEGNGLSTSNWPGSPTDAGSAGFEQSGGPWIGTSVAASSGMGYSWMEEDTGFVGDVQMASGSSEIMEGQATGGSVDYTIGYQGWGGDSSSTPPDSVPDLGFGMDLDSFNGLPPTDFSLSDEDFMDLVDAPDFGAALENLGDVLMEDMAPLPGPTLGSGQPFMDHPMSDLQPLPLAPEAEPNDLGFDHAMEGLEDDEGMDVPNGGGVGVGGVGGRENVGRRQPRRLAGRIAGQERRAKRGL